MERVATCEPSDCHPTSLPEAMFVDRFISIFRTRRNKTACWRHAAGDRSLIPPNHDQCDGFHRAASAFSGSSTSRPARPNRESIASPSRQKPAPAAGSRAIRTMSQPGATCVSLARVASRSQRLTRFLTTAPPRRLLTTKPKRLWERPFSAARSTSKGWDHDRPNCRTCWNSCLWTRR